MAISKESSRLQQTLKQHGIDGSVITGTMLFVAIGVDTIGNYLENAAYRGSRYPQITSYYLGAPAVRNASNSLPADTMLAFENNRKHAVLEALDLYDIFYPIQREEAEVITEVYDARYRIEQADSTQDLVDVRADLQKISEEMWEKKAYFEEQYQKDPYVQQRKKNIVTNLAGMALVGIITGLNWKTIRNSAKYAKQMHDTKQLLR